jgi:hypothetical protein
VGIEAGKLVPISFDLLLVILANRCTGLGVTRHFIGDDPARQLGRVNLDVVLTRHGWAPGWNGLPLRPALFPQGDDELPALSVDRLDAVATCSPRRAGRDLG